MKVIKYKKVVAKNGREMFFENGNMVSPDKVPASILNNLEDGVEISTGTPEPEETVDEKIVDNSKLHPSKNTCVFCGNVADKSRFLQQVTIYLCEEDYSSHTTGEIVHEYNKKNN